jgi:hypothetical protein
MKKIWSILVISFLLIGSLGVIASKNKDYTKTEFIYKATSSKISFSKVLLEQNNKEYLEVNLEGISTYIMTPGEPMLPKVVQTIELPFGVKNVNVEVTLNSIKEQILTREIKPAPAPLPLIETSKTNSNEQLKDESIYKSTQPYPNADYKYDIRCGLNEKLERVTFVNIQVYPIQYIPAENKLFVAEDADIKVTYDQTNYDYFPETAEYDLLIISPKKFEKYLEPLVEHKNNLDVKTKLITTGEIYEEYGGVDKPEQIKYCIKDIIETYNIKYVLLVGGLKSQVYAKPRDDANQGSKGWYLPVRYTNLYDKPKFPLASEETTFDPGVISDLYYADIYDGKGNFSSWDPTNDGIFAAWAYPDPSVKNDTDIDMVPDVCVGRLACRSLKEVKTVVDKIIKYENSSLKESEWFNKATVISGDGFLDQEDLNIQWDTTGLPNGHYTIYAQSFDDEGEEGPTDTIPIKINRRQETKITFNHDDNLLVPNFPEYPAPPIAEIVTISPGDILGYNDYKYTPDEGEAYCNDFNPWANISYVDGVLTIRGKSYDPKPYANVTDIHVWIKDKNGNVVFSEWRYDLETYYEGEWTTGEKVLYNRGGALYYMDGFEKEIIWTSNGKYSSQKDILNALKEGSGFVFMSGHGSPNSWGDQYPGIPGNRKYGSAGSLTVTNIKPWAPYVKFPLYPVDSLNNGEKLPICVIGGCHNSQFNVSMIPGLYQGLIFVFKFLPDNSIWCHGVPVPECMSWRFVRNPNGGAIATIGNTGLGYGMPGKVLTIGGGDGWITIEFFRQYGEHNQTVLGQAHSQAITEYIETFDMNDLESGHPKSVQQWVLLGDPSLQIGGYS